MVAATGDDKVNLVLSLLAKTEFAVPRVVARVNRAENEWLFTDQWGVDVSVSKPRLMAALVEEAVTVGDLVRLMTFRQSQANLVEITLPETAPYVGHAVRDVPLPRDSALVAILRGKRVVAPTPADTLEAGDELVFVCTSEVEDDVRAVILGERATRRPGRRLSCSGDQGTLVAPDRPDRQRQQQRVRREAQRDPHDAENGGLLVVGEPVGEVDQHVDHAPWRRRSSPRPR